MAVTRPIGPARPTVPITEAWYPTRPIRRAPGVQQRFAPPPPTGIRVPGTPTVIIGVAKTQAISFPKARAARVVPAGTP